MIKLPVEDVQALITLTSLNSPSSNKDFNTLYYNNSYFGTSKALYQIPYNTILSCTKKVQKDIRNEILNGIQIAKKFYNRLKVDKLYDCKELPIRADDITDIKDQLYIQKMMSHPLLQSPFEDGYFDIALQDFTPPTVSTFDESIIELLKATLYGYNDFNINEHIYYGTIRLMFNLPDVPILFDLDNLFDKYVNNAKIFELLRDVYTNRKLLTDLKYHLTKNEYTTIYKMLCLYDFLNGDTISNIINDTYITSIKDFMVAKCLLNSKEDDCVYKTVNQRNKTEYHFAMEQLKPNTYEEIFSVYRLILHKLFIIINNKVPEWYKDSMVSYVKDFEDTMTTQEVEDIINQLNKQFTETTDTYINQINDLQQQVTTLQKKSNDTDRQLLLANNTNNKLQKYIDTTYKTEIDTLQERNVELSRKLEKLTKKYNTMAEEYVVLKELFEDDNIEDIKEEITQEKETHLIDFNKKYYFTLGKDSNKEFIQLLNETFPNSIVLDGKSLGVSEIDKNAIAVIFKKFMAHNYYYEMKNVFKKAEIPIIHANSTNIEKIIDTIQENI